MSVSSSPHSGDSGERVSPRPSETWREHVRLREALEYLNQEAKRMNEECKNHPRRCPHAWGISYAVATIKEALNG